MKFDGVFGTICVAFLSLVALVGCGSPAPHTPIRATSSTVFTIFGYEKGRLARTVDVSQGSSVFTELLTYSNSDAVLLGKATNVSHAPNLVIQSDKLQINIMKFEVVVSTRDTVDGLWQPVVRSKSVQDSQIESSIRLMLKEAGNQLEGR